MALLAALGCDAAQESEYGCSAVSEPATEEAPAAEDIRPVLLAYDPVEVAWERAASGDESSPVSVVTTLTHDSTRQLRIEGPLCSIRGVARLFPARLDIDIGNGQARGAVDLALAAFGAELAEIHAKEWVWGPVVLSAEWAETATSQGDFTDGEWNIEVGGSLDAFGLGMSTRTDNSVSGYWWGTLVTE